VAWTRLAWGCCSARTTSTSTTVGKCYGYMRTADPIGTAYDRLLQSMQTYRSTQLSFFRGIGRSGRRTPSHSQHCSGSLVVVSMLRGYRRIKIEEIPRKRYKEAMMSQRKAKGSGPSAIRRVCAHVVGGPCVGPWPYNLYDLRLWCSVLEVIGDPNGWCGALSRLASGTKLGERAQRASRVR